MTAALTQARMQSDDPSIIANPISIPPSSPPSPADIDDRTSGAPVPKAKNVTPARLSDILKVFEICFRDGVRNSSAVKLSR